MTDIPSDLPATSLAFRNDAYQQSMLATPLEVHEDMLILDGTLFYATSGGQPSDLGTLAGPDEMKTNLIEARYLDVSKTIIGHKLPEGAADWLMAGPVWLGLDFERRFKLMRMHSALHLLSVVLPYAVTGGSVGVEDSRLDFDIPEGGLDKDEITEKLNALTAKEAAITDRWITEEELDDNPGLVKTMSVQPPRGTGRIRLVEIAGLDLQPCGGTHVKNTREIGNMIVTNIEKKGKLNRRVRIAFA